MKNWRFFAVALALALFLPGLAGHAYEPTKLNTLMRKKLEHSQKVLEAIALNDFDRITSNANELLEISKAAEWRVQKTPQYEVYSNDFRRNAEALAEAGKKKNLDAATLAYVDLTLNCVKCHKHVREVRMGRLDLAPNPDRVVARSTNALKE